MRMLIIIVLLLGCFLLKGQTNFKLSMMVNVADRDTTYCFKSTKVFHRQRLDTLIFLFEDEILVFHPCEKKRPIKRGLDGNGKVNRTAVSRYNKSTRTIQTCVEQLNLRRNSGGEVERYALVQDYFNKDRYIIHLIVSTKRAWLIFFITNYDRPGHRSSVLGYNASVCGGVK